jgi:3-oxoacyl-[acyl-carrier-protein] synthase II
MKRVVVTGIGAVSPLGNSFQDSWNAAKNGLSGIETVTRFDTTNFSWKVAGELKEFDPGAYLSRKEVSRLDAFIHYAVAAAVMAAKDAGLISELLSRAGVIIGSSRGGIGTLEKAILKNQGTEPDGANKLSGNSRRVSAYLMPATTISMASSSVAQKLGMRGYCLGISNACASGTNAIGEAYRLIRSGYRYPVFCGGAEAPVCRICFEGYGASGALSKVHNATASRPFDGTRDGFVLAEGACILTLEEYNSARKRGARIYGEITGYGNTSDAFHQTLPAAEGEARAICAAIDEAHLKPDNIGFINAHGTSTPTGDRTESEAIKISFGSRAYHIPVTSVKSMTGHMLAASGALEAAFTLKSMEEGIIPPTINLRQRDPACDLDYVKETRKAEIAFALSHSFGFGGVNAVLVLKSAGD